MATIASFILKVADVASLPSDNAAGTEGRLAFAASEQELYRDNGATWDKIADVGGGGSLALDDLTDVSVSGASSGNVLTFNGTNWGAAAPSGGGGGSPDYILIEDVKSAGTSGGAFNQDGWRTRDLNTESEDTGGHASVSSNQITLAAGTYRVQIAVPGFRVNYHRARLWDVTNSGVLLLGANASSGAGSYVQTDSIIRGTITLASTTTVRVEHWCNATNGTDGFGGAVSLDGTSERFTAAEFWKIA